MTDREMLEFAAKAAGMTIHAANQAQRDACGAGDVGLWISNDTTCWNPLTDDGDALRTAVKLGIEIFPDLQVNEVRTAFMVGSYGYNTAEQIGTDRIAAVRRVIVRAAAEIGRRMK